MTLSPYTKRSLVTLWEWGGAMVGRLFYFPYLWRFRMVGPHSGRLHLGCGSNRFPGWINADILPGADLILFMERRLPFKDGSLQRIYSEHVLEHVSFETGIRFLRDANRALAPGGVIRIAMPDLDDLIDGYQGDWRRFDWVNWPQHAFIRTRAEMINIAFRWWGHKHLYNQEELLRALAEAGFSQVRFVERGWSEMADLCGLERRLDSKLVAEAVKG